jgi:hypothetical protein
MRVLGRFEALKGILNEKSEALMGILKRNEKERMVVEMRQRVVSFV